MAAEADIQVPICETRGDQVGNFVDNIINISVSKLSIEKHIRDEQPNEHPTVEGENFLRPPSTGEVHSEVNNASAEVSKVAEEPDQAGTLLPSNKLDDQPIETAANKGISAVQIQQNGEESNSTEKDGDHGTDSSVVISEMKVDDKLGDGGARVVTQLSNDIGSDHHGTKNSITENITLTKEIVQDTSQSKETESQAPFISEGEKKPPEEDQLFDLASEVSKEGEFDQCKMNSEKEVVLANEISDEANFNTASEEVSQGSTPTETAVELETSNNDKVESKSEQKSSFSKEEETTAQNGDKKSTDHSIPVVAENSQETSLVQVHDSQIECDEHLEEETKRLPSTEVSTEVTNDNVQPATHNEKVKDEDLIEVELSENQPSTRCLLAEKDRQIETPAETLLVTPENIEVSDLSQGNSMQGPPEEQSTNPNLQGRTIEAEEATIDAVDLQKESLESCPPIASSSPKVGSMKAVPQEVTSNHVEVRENLSVGEGHTEVNNLAHDFTEVTEEPNQTLRDGKVEFAANEETPMEEIQPNAEEIKSTEKEGDEGALPEQCSTDSSVMTSEVKEGDALNDPDVDDAREVTQLSKGISIDQHETNDSYTKNNSPTKEILEETNIPNTETESQTPCIREVEEQNVQVKTADNKSQDEKTTEDDNLRSEVSKEEESDQCKTASEAEVLANERSVEDNTSRAAAELSQRSSTPTESIVILEVSNNDELQSKNDINSSFTKEEETTVQTGDKISTTSEDSGFPLENTLSESHGDEEFQSQNLEGDATDHSIPNLPEKSKETSLVQVHDSQIECDEHLEEEIDRLPSTEVSTGATNDNVPPTTHNVKDKGEDLFEAELSENEPSKKCLSVEEDRQIETPVEALLVNRENIEASNLNQENRIQGLPAQQSTNTNLQGNTIEAEETTIDAVDRQQESLENVSIGEAHTEINSISPDLIEVTEEPCIREVEELNVQFKTTDNKSEDSKITEEDMSCDLKSEESKEAESDQNKTATDQEVLSNERSIEDNSKAAAGEVDQEDSTSTETITTLETSNSDELQSKCESNSSFSKEEEMTTEKGDRSVTASEDQGVPLDESQGDDKSQSKNLEDAATDRSYPKLAEKSEESSLVHIEDSKIECDEHLGQESERLTLVEISTGATNDNIPPVTDIVKDKDEDLKEAELSQNEPVKEDRQIETHAESVLVAHEEVSTLSQENNIKGQIEEQSTDAALDGNINEVEEATIDAVDQQKESSESSPPIVSSSPEEGGTNAVLQEVTSDHSDKVIEEVDKHAKVQENHRIGEAHSEINNIAPDINEVTEKPDQPVEIAANEDISAEEIQQNAEDGDKGVAPEQCNTDTLAETSEVKARDTLDDFDVDDASVQTQLSKDTKKILEETNISREATESQAPSVTEGEEPNVQIKTTDNKCEDEKPTEEDKSCNLTSEVSKEGDSDQNKMTSGQEVFASETSVEDNFNTAADDISQEHCASTETITALETSNNSELQSNSDSILSFSKEDETIVQIGDRSVTTSKNYGVPLENSLTENHGDIEYLPKTSEDAATDHSDSKPAEKSEESSLDQIEDSQIEHDKHLEVESERLPLTDASTGGTNDNVSEAIDKVNDGGKDHEEDVQLEHTAESLHVAPKCNEESDLHHEDKINGPLEEQITNAHLHGDPNEAQDTAISEVVDQHKESLEVSPPIVSSSPEEGSMNPALKEVTRDHADNIIEEDGKHKEVIEIDSTTVSTEDTAGSSIKLEGSENQNEEDLGKESEKTPLPLPLTRDVSDESNILQEPQFEDGESTKVEFCNTERSTESVLLETEHKTENTEDTSNVTSADNKTPDLSLEIETNSVIEEHNLSRHPQGIPDKRSDGGIVDETEVKEDTLENIATETAHKHIEENPVTQVDFSGSENEECLEKDNQHPSLAEAKIEETSSRDLESTKNEEADVEKHVDSLQVKPEDIEQRDSSLDINNSIEEQISDTDPQESDNIEKEPINAVDKNEESLEAKDIAKSNLDLNKDAANDEESRKDTECGLIKDEESIESLQVTANNVEETHLGQDTETSCLDEQSTIANTEADTDDKKEGIADNANGSENETAKDKIIATTLCENKKENLQLQEDCSLLEQNEDLGHDSESTPFMENPKVYTTESSLVREEQVEKPVEEQIITADPQETCDKIPENIVGAADEKDDVVVNFPNRDNGDSSPIEVDGSKDPSSEEVSAEAINDDEPTAVHETNFANENTGKANLFEEEKKIGSALAKEEVCIESLQVTDEDIKATSSVQDRELSHLEEKAPTTDSQGAPDDHNGGKTIHLADVKEEIVEDKNYAATPDEDNNEDSPIPVEGTLLEHKVHSEKDSERTSLTSAPKDGITESISVREVAQTEDPIHSSKVATEDIKEISSGLDTEIRSAENQILDPEDTSSNKIAEKSIEATGKETQEIKDIAKSAWCEEDSPNVEDGSQKPSLVEDSSGNVEENESANMHEVKFVDESLIKADLMENEENTEATLIKEDVSIELPQVAAEDIKEPCLSELRESNSQEEQILSADPGGLIDDNKTIDPVNFQEETPKDEDKSSNLTAEKTPCAEDLDVNEDIIGHIPEVSNYKQQEPSITKVSEEHTTMSNEHASDNTSLGSEVFGEANTGGEKIDSEKIEVSNDGSIAVPTNETLAETDSRGSKEAEVQVPNGEKDTELSIKEAEIDQKSTKETLLCNATEYAPELEGLNEAKTDSKKASQEVSTSYVAVEEDSSQEPRRETREETETEEPKKADKEFQDSSVENIERDAQPCLASANDFGITEEVQNLKEVPLPAPEENIIETTNCEESDGAEGEKEGIGHPEQNDATKSFSDDKGSTEEMLEETAANDMFPVSPSETSGVEHYTTKRELTIREELCTEKTASGDDEKEACDQKISDISSTSPDTIQTRDTDVVELTNDSDSITENTESPKVNENTCVESILINDRSAAYLETKNDAEAPEIKETTPSAAEGQDLESASVEENSNYPGSLTEEKLNSDEVTFVPGENKSGYESNKVLEYIAQADKPEAENTLEQEETVLEKEILKDSISSEKEQFIRTKAEDEDIKDHNEGSCEEEVIGDSQQEQQKISKETTEFIEDRSQTETVSEVCEVAGEKAPEDQEEKIFTNEAIDTILHPEEQAKSIGEPTTKIDTIKAQELDIQSVKPDSGDSIKEGVQLAMIPGKESEEQNHKDEICSSDTVQEKDEKNIMLSEGKSEEEVKEAYTCTKPNEDEDKEAHIEAKTEGLSECTVSDCAHIPEDNDISMTKEIVSEENYPSKIIEVEASTGSEDIALREQASEATIATAEVQEAEAGVDLGVAVPKSTGIESRELEEVNDKCAAMESDSTPVEPPVLSTSKIIPEWKVGTPLEAEDQQTKLHDLSEELDMKDSEVKLSEKDDAVILQSVRDISKDVQELSKESFNVSNNENPVERDPKEKIETNEGQETKPAQNVHVSETPEQETEEKQLGGTEDVHEEQKKINSAPHQLESTYGTESSIHQSYVDDMAQHEKREINQQIDSLPSLPQAQFSSIKTSEKELLLAVPGSGSVDVAELEASPLRLKDKHVVLEADDTRNLNRESLGGDKNISPEHSQGEHEIKKPSKVEQEAECGNEERTDQEMEGKPEPKEAGKPSLSDLFQVSMRGKTQIEFHSATEKEPTSHTEDQRAENSDEAEQENSKTDEEKDDEEESYEQRKSDSVSEAPVMVYMGDADVKVAHKKSHNILSGVGSKVKHSIAKVKKAITGKSSHPKPPSPKKVTN